ncbi:MAG: hypothetical protein ACUVXA_08845 [Candidatus Jordarchaeum sp.]|uniref:hypothetical protein n=1 Tax=Candidatus Jordarchaeum sp. TaxID=2823881 RepID=UPI004048FA17
MTVESVRIRLEDELTLINRLISEVRRDLREGQDHNLSSMLIRLEKAREQLVRALIYANEDFEILPKWRDNPDYIFNLNLFIKYLEPERFFREFSFGDFKADLLIWDGTTWGFLWIVNEPEECFSLIKSLYEFLETIKDYKKADPIIYKLKVHEREGIPFRVLFCLTKNIPINLLEEVQSLAEENIIMQFFLLDLEKFPHMIIEPLL